MMIVLNQLIFNQCNRIEIFMASRRILFQNKYRTKQRYYEQQGSHSNDDLLIE
jgi:hypothetical protein